MATPAQRSSDSSGVVRPGGAGDVVLPWRRPDEPSDPLEGAAQAGLPVPVAWLGRTSTEDQQDPSLSLPRQLELRERRVHLVHAADRDGPDLTGNVLFANGLAPAIIDISPYWRPPAYAEGVVVADALCWHDAPASLADDLGVPRSAVARALLFRLLATNARVASGVDVEQVREEAQRYELAADIIGV